MPVNNRRRPSSCNLRRGGPLQRRPFGVSAGDIGRPGKFLCVGAGEGDDSVHRAHQRVYGDRHRSRRKYDLDRQRTWLRAAAEELRQVARAVARKLNKARGPVKVIVPRRGWSSVDCPGNPTYDPEEDLVFMGDAPENPPLAEWDERGITRRAISLLLVSLPKYLKNVLT